MNLKKLFNSAIAYCAIATVFEMMPLCSDKHHPNHEIGATFDFHLHPHQCSEFEFNAILTTGGPGVEQKREQKGELAATENH